MREGSPQSSRKLFHYSIDSIVSGWLWEGKDKLDTKQHFDAVQQYSTSKGSKLQAPKQQTKLARITIISTF
jgi:hypothetical protein